MSIVDIDKRAPVGIVPAKHTECFISAHSRGETDTYLGVCLPFFVGRQRKMNTRTRVGTSIINAPMPALASFKIVFRTCQQQLRSRCSTRTEREKMSESSIERPHDIDGVQAKLFP